MIQKLNNTLEKIGLPCTICVALFASLFYMYVNYRDTFRKNHAYSIEREAILVEKLDSMTEVLDKLDQTINEFDNRLNVVESKMK